MEQGQAAVDALDAMLTRLAGEMQWDIDKLMVPITVAVSGQIRPEQLILAVTSCDLYGGTNNFLFGGARLGQHLGVVSTVRFRATFSDEAPQRDRLNERLVKQSLSTIGFMLGVPRCDTPECARAFPVSLFEHDQKPSILRAKCRAGFEKALGKALPPP